MHRYFKQKLSGTYTNTNTKIQQIQKYTNTNTTTQIRKHKYTYSNTKFKCINIQIRIHKFQMTDEKGGTVGSQWGANWEASRFREVSKIPSTNLLFFNLSTKFNLKKLKC